MSIIPHNLSVKGKMRYLKSEAQLISGWRKCNRKLLAGEMSRLHFSGSSSDLLPGNSGEQHNRYFFFRSLHNSGCVVVW